MFLIVTFCVSKPNSIINHIIYITGVSGCGKSTVGKLLSTKTSIPFFDGDDFHPQTNIDKMASGNALNDDDRKEWLLSLNALATEQLKHNGGIIACSALKESYRKTLSHSLESNVRWVLLNGSKKLIQNRLDSRANHFMPSILLQSQFDILEVPEYGLYLDIADNPENLVNTIIETYKL